ncbi:uncharacterized protein LOC131154213 isoform X1 [Malania oleifera]|uniref:uncharacterized protein LOC131154213 isoform X1 n=1 Tax=Malania oleifera TaxID=397392 RepID=UPI0025AE1D94|nr:uncharacterized protein LOC131154213 isoform X1 [Malania oleifera]
MKNYIASFAGIWKERGVTLMCDGWSGPTRKHIINFLVYCDRGTVFHKSVDASDVPSRTAEYYFRLMDEVVEEIGEENVVQVVTDNEAAMKAGGKLLMQKRPNLYWTACAAHCIDLILEDIGKKSNVKKVLEDARTITSFIYNHTWTVNFMKKFTNNRELLRPAITRFATNFIALETIVRHKQALREMFTSDAWKNSRFGMAKLGPAYDSKKIILGKEFWQKASDIIKVQEPLVKVLKLVDGDEKPTMGFIYEAIDRAKLAIQKDCRFYKDYWKIIDNRWSFQLHQDLHAAGYFLNPQFLYGAPPSPEVAREVMDGVKKVITKLVPDIDTQIQAINQVACNVRGKLDPPCNAVGYIDREVLGINHIYQHPAWKRSKVCTVNSPHAGPFRNDAPSWCQAPFEPEGIISSLSSILSTIIGVHFGHVLIHLKVHSNRLKHWVVMGLALLILGIILHFTDAIPLNKQLYTFSYVCVTSGSAALVFSAFYILVDIWGFRHLFLPLEWIGMNAMLVYVMAAEGIFAGFINGWYYDDPHNTLVYWIQKHIFVEVWHSIRVGILLYVIFAEILFWGIVSGILHQLGIYWKL